MRDDEDHGDLGERLAAATLELVDIPSESRHERAIADHVEDTLMRVAFEAEVVRHGNCILTLPRPGSRPGTRVLVVGHLDTVPAQGTLPGRREDGTVFGLGAADMKGALAVMLELAAWCASHVSDRGPDLGPNPGPDLGPNPGPDVGFVFYEREELPVAESGLTPLFDAHPSALDAALAIVMEPTRGEIQMGCLGNVQADVVFRGKSSHSARPWLGVNAVHRGIRGLYDVSGLEPVDDEIDGLVYREVCSITRVEGGIAANVIPDEMRAHVNFRYSPRRTREEAEARLHDLVVGDEVEIVSNAAGAMPCGENPLLRSLQHIAAAPVTPKQAWTDVAQFTAHGIDAVNFGPGDPHLAHTREESVDVEALVHAFTVLSRLLVASEP
ncbi:MAG: succinyl-diaminopimelate desuccinylase [Acidimicrobiia bacterium]|nr:succinyl-diaminopimelate desuccinylase [Acidimicrobiia bacterium]